MKRITFVYRSLFLGFLAFIAYELAYGPYIRNKDVISTIRENVSPFVYRFNTAGSHCTGFDLTHRGRTFLVSNQHCCDNEREFLIDGVYKKRIASSVENDICLVEAVASHGLHLNVKDLNIGDTVFSMGFPSISGKTLRAGSVREARGFTETYVTEDKTRTYRTLKLYLKVLGGQSGSPVVDVNGSVRGIIVSANTFMPYMSSAIPAVFIADLINQTIENERRIEIQKEIEGILYGEKQQ